MVCIGVIDIARPGQLADKLRLIRVQPIAQAVKTSVLVPELGIHIAEQDIRILGNHEHASLFRGLIAHHVVVFVGKVQHCRVKFFLHGLDFFKWVNRR